MAQEKGFSNKNSPVNSDNEDDDLSNGNNSVKPDLGFENVNYSNNATELEGNRPEKKVANQARKEESSFSFKHFLKRDLSLPSTSASYEGTGARPKVYSGSASRRQGGDAGLAASSEISEAAPPDRDPPGLPSLPDFVQDHLLLEQAYLGGGASLDLDNLPDFTFSCSQPYRSPRPHSRLALDLTDCVERPQPAPHPFPLDLPSGASGGESLRLPDFLPSQAGEGAGGARERERERDRRRGREEVQEERRLRTAAQQEAAALRREVQAARLSEQRHSSETPITPGNAECNDNSLVAALRLQIEQLKEELRTARAEVEDLRSSRRGVARSLIYATNTAEGSLRELLSGLEQVRALASSLEPP